MKVIYIVEKDVFFSSDGQFYTHDELDYLDNLEAEWRATLPNFTLIELMEIFPGARATAKRHTRERIKAMKDEINKVAQEREDFGAVINKAPFNKQAELIATANKNTEDKMTILESHLKKLMFQLDYLQNKPASPNSVSGTEVEQAKSVPIAQVYQGKLSGSQTLQMGLCPFHNEKTASFAVYVQQNKFYCFSCSRNGDVIDLAQHTWGIDFKSAVKKLIGKA